MHDVQVIDISNDDSVVKALKKDPAHDQEEALKDIYREAAPWRSADGRERESAC